MEPLIGLSGRMPMRTVSEPCKFMSVLFIAVKNNTDGEQGC